MLRVSPTIHLVSVVLLFAFASSVPVAVAAPGGQAGAASAGQHGGKKQGSSQQLASVDDFIVAVRGGPVAFTRADGRIVLTAAPGSQVPAHDARPPGVSEAAFIAMLEARPLTAQQAQVLWELLADQRHVDLARPAVVAALVKASATPETREVMWSELGGLARATRRAAASSRSKSRAVSSGPRGVDLLDVFESNRATLKPLLGDLRQSDTASEEIIELMRRSLVFGATTDEAASYVSYRLPAAVARYMERERGLGDPPAWEQAAFESIARWKYDTLAGMRSSTMEEADAAGRDYIVVFNCLHWFDEGHRDVMLAGLGPEILFNAVVAGEKELYRLGTSSYRNFLHDAIMGGVKKRGSLEAFVDEATRRLPGGNAADAKRRGVVFLRVAAAFGLLEPVLTSIDDRDRFVAAAITSVADPRTFEANSAIVLDVLLAQSQEPVVVEFKRALLMDLYRHYSEETRPVERAIFGSVLSVYQTLGGGGDARNPAIDRDFPLDDAAFRIPFERLFTDEGDGSRVHRILQRFDRNDEDTGLYAEFRARMKARGASVRNGTQYDVFRIDRAGRSIEIYVNRPSTAGLRRGIAGIAGALGGKRVGTVIGRGHTSILAPLQTDAKLVLGDRVKDVSAVIVGTCGGDASVRGLIATFGYIPLISTAATGRQIINDAIEAGYIDALLALKPGETLVVSDVLQKAVAPFRRRGTEDGLRSDAGFYNVNMASVYTARLFDTHVRPLLADVRTASGG